MKFLGLGMAVAIMLLASGALISHKSSQVGHMNSIDSANTVLIQSLSRIEAAGIHEVDCKALHAGFTVAGSHCFLSTMDAEKLLPLTKSQLDNIASTPGWEENYGVYSAFYVMKSNQEYSFGVNIKKIAGDHDLDGLSQTKGYKSYLSVIVEKGGQ